MAITEVEPTGTPRVFTRCAGSELAVGVTGDAYDPVETFPCPLCGAETAVYTDFHTVRLRDHLRAVA